MSKDKKILEIDNDSEPNLLLVKCPYCHSIYSISKEKLREILKKGTYKKGKF